MVLPGLLLALLHTLCFFFWSILRINLLAFCILYFPALTVHTADRLKSSYARCTPNPTHSRYTGENQDPEYHSQFSKATQWLDGKTVLGIWVFTNGSVCFDLLSTAHMYCQQAVTIMMWHFCIMLHFRLSRLSNVPLHVCTPCSWSIHNWKDFNSHSGGSAGF